MKLPLLLKREGHSIRALQMEIDARVAKYSLQVRAALKKLNEEGDVFVLVETSGIDYPAKLCGNIGKRAVDVIWPDKETNQVRIENICDILSESEYLEMVSDFSDVAAATAAAEKFKHNYR